MDLLACNHVSASTRCVRCAYVESCIDCTDCQYCFGCVGLSNAEFHILNEPYERKIYFELVTRLSRQVLK